MALASLIVIDLIDCLTYPNQQYNIGSREAQLSSGVELDDSEEMASLARQHGSTKQADDCLPSSLGSRLVEQSNSRKVETDRERERSKKPLLPARAKHSSLGDLNCDDDDNDDDDDDDENDDGAIFDVINKIHKVPAGNENNHSTTPARHLTKASYIYNNSRTQSPLFVNNSASKATQSQSNSNSSLNKTEPPKSVLKKSTSFQRVDTNNDDDDDDDADAMEEYQRQMQRDMQTRRSLLNVRFAE